MKQSIRINSVAAAVAAAFGAVAAPAYAQLPSGPTVVNGTAGVASDGTRMTITNSANAVLNWQSFSIGAPNSVRFEQPSASSQVLNRVVGNDPSNILGSLSSNGGVWLVNPHGVLFGSNARIDVAGLVASSLGISNDDFLAGRARFDGAGLPSGQVLNRGELQTSFGGHVWLMGGSVSNEGLIRSPGGSIVLAAGKSIELVDSGAPNVAVRVAAPDNQALNLGQLLAPGGGSIDIHGGIVNQQGIVRADSVGLDAAGRVTIKAQGDIQLGAGGETSASAAGSGAGGKVLVESAGGDTLVQGGVAATSSSGAGGQVHLLGKNVGVYGQALVDASGAAGGGEVLVGGDYQGGNPAVRNAAQTYLGPAATVKADTTRAGDGGKIIFWGDDATRVYGAIQARGGPQGGNGGFVETSGHALDANPARIDLGASGGKAGTWLLDPGNVHIVASNSLEGGMANDDVPGFGRISTSDNASIRAQTIVDALSQGTDVTIRTGGDTSTTTQAGDIVVDSSVIVPAGPTSIGSLTLEAHHDFIMQAGTNIQSDGAPLAVTVLADRLHQGHGNIVLHEGASVSTRGGDLRMTIPSPFLGQDGTLTMERNSGLHAGTGSINLQTGAVSMTDSAITAANIDTTSGEVTMTNSTVNATSLDGSSLTMKMDKLTMDSSRITVLADTSPTLPSLIKIETGGFVMKNASEVSGARNIDLTASTSDISDSQITAMSPRNSSVSINSGHLGLKNASVTSTLLGFSNPGGTIDITAQDFTMTDSSLASDGATSITSASFSLAAATGAARIDAAGVSITSGTVDLNHATIASSIAEDAIDIRTDGLTNTSSALSAPSGRWLIFLRAGQTGFPFPDLGDLDYKFVQFGVDSEQSTAVNGIGQNGILLADQLDVRIRVDATRYYNGSTYAPFTAAEFSDVPTGFQVQPRGSVSSLPGSFRDKKAGDNKPVDFNDGGNAFQIATSAGIPVYGDRQYYYADIKPVAVTTTGLSAENKVYDGSRDATVYGVLSGAIGNDDVSVGGLTGLFDTKNAGTAKTVTVSGGVLDGADAGNYFLESGGVTTADITPKPATIGLTGEVAKIYDATTGATLGSGNFTLQGLVAGDAVNIAGPALGSYDTRHVGQEKLVSASGSFTIGGADAPNYSIGSTVLTSANNVIEASASGNVGTITPKSISASGLTADNKVYDRSRIATVSGTLAGAIGNDDVHVTGISAQFDTKDVGTGKTVTITGGTLTGADAGDYLFTGGTTTTADITPRPVSAGDVHANDKVYDGNTAATLTASLSGVLPGDVLGIGTLSGQFDNKNVGHGKLVTVTSNGLTGADAANYMLNGPLTTTASITPKPATIGLTGEITKIYDATTGATLGSGNFTLEGVVAGDAVNIAGPVQGSYDTRNAGDNKLVSASGNFTITGADAMNYSIGTTLLTSATNIINTSASGNIGSITQKSVSAAGLTAENKIYDGNRNATLSGTPSGIIGGDNVSVTGISAVFDTKNAGNGKIVSISGGTLSGADAGNYSFSGGATTTANISPRPITAAGLLANDKVYDGSTSATLSGSLSGVLPGDVLGIGTLSGEFDNKNVGNNKVVTFASSGLTGADAGNYVLIGPLATTASITPKPVTISITGTVSKEYDATYNASLGVGQFALNGIVANDAVTVRGPAQGSYDSPNAGSGRQVSASGAFNISGADAPNYSVGGIALASASNVINASASGNVGIITPATLIYTAAPATGEPGLPATGLGGTVTGFKGTDTLANATTGTLVWQSDAALQSTPGAYPVNGAGLSASNYNFVQAPANATALAVKFNLSPAKPQLQAQESSVQAVSTALRTVILAADSRGSGGVLDQSSPAATRSFGSMRIGSMNQNELEQLLAQRREFKRKLFADAVYKLEIDPSLADVQLCASAADAVTGACRLTPAQVELIHATKRPAQVAARSASGRVAALPQIERKIVVLFGINDYQDKTIPQLENAVPDVDAVSRTFAEKLGYEVRVVHNPDKAAMIRTLNELAAEMNSADSVIIYYAGHGFAPKKNGPGYWIPSDAKASDPRSWISNSDVAKAMANISAKQMALISDSCYSGAFARDGLDAVGHDVSAADVLAKRSVVVLSSGGDEPVADEGKEGHSIFAWNLMQVIGSVTDWKPGSTIFTNVQAAVKKEFPQTPQYGSVTAAGHQAGGEYLFELR